MIRILHTADLHLGMKFRSAGFCDDIREKVANARPKVLKNIIQCSRDYNCDLVTIGGDLFDSPRVTKREINEVVSILEESSVPVAILPGNHDYFQSDAGTLWPELIAKLGGTPHWVMTENRPYPIDELRLTLFPGVCNARHSNVNAIGWISKASHIVDESHLRIGIAHGSLEGLSPDFDSRYFPMTRADMAGAGMNAWLLGHTHIRYPDAMVGSGETVFFPSTPEPDGFGCSHDGHALIIDLDDNGRTRHEFVRVGAYRFRTISKALNSQEDVDAVIEQFDSLETSRDLVRLKLTGRVPREIFEGKTELINRLRKRVLHLDDDVDGLLCLIRQKDINWEFTEGSFPHRLLSALSQDEIDSQALQIAYQLITENRL